MQEQLALVTGGTGGIGTATCIALAGAGYQVVALEPPSRLEESRVWQTERQRDDDVRVELAFADVSSFESCAQAASDIREASGTVSVLVNAAGITRDATLRKMDADQWSAVLRTNLDSMFNVTRQFIEPMIEQGFGRVINISSVNGRKGQFGQTNYASAKAGVHGFTMSLAQEVARNGVTVNTISPGYVATPMVMAMREDIRQQIIDQIPVGRAAEPAEIAHAIGFLAHRDSGYITGANLDINGGIWMG